MNVEKTDKWDKAKIIAEIGIAVAGVAITAVGLIFTVSYNEKSQRTAEANLRLAEANLQLGVTNVEVAKAQVKSALLQSLSSEDPRQRAIALYLAKAQDPVFAVEVARVYSLNDPSQEVQKTARATLGSLAQNAPDEIRRQAEKGLDQYDIMNELRTKGLLEKLNQARGYFAGGGITGEETALRLYREAVSQLSSSARNKLDQKLLGDAEKDFKNGYRDDALRKYDALFADYRQAS